MRTVAITLTQENTQMLGWFLIGAAVVVALGFLPAFVAYSRRTAHRGIINLVCMVPILIQIVTYFEYVSDLVMLFGYALWFVLLMFAFVDQREPVTE